MPSKYLRASQETYGILNEVLNQYYQELNAHSVSIDLLMAFAPEVEGEEKLGAALKLGGYQCSAIVSVVPLKHRVMGRGDAEILIDGDRWPSMSIEQQRALLDHECQHLVISRNAKGEVLLDTHGRPKLKMKLHDRQFGFFDVVAERHKENSMEVEQCTAWMEDAGYTYFPFMKDIKLIAGKKPKSLPKKKDGEP